MRRFLVTPRGRRRSGCTLLLWRKCWLNTWTGPDDAPNNLHLFFFCCCLNKTVCFPGSLKCFTPCPRTSMMIFSMKMISGLTRNKTGKIITHIDVALSLSCLTLDWFFMPTQSGEGCGDHLLVKEPPSELGHQNVLRAPSVGRCHCGED